MVRAYPRSGPLGGFLRDSEAHTEHVPGSFAAPGFFVSFEPEAIYIYTRTITDVKTALCCQEWPSTT